MADPRQEVIDSPEFIGGVYVEIEDQFQNISYVEPLTDAIGLLKQQHEAMFAAEVDSAGNPWPVLSPYTINRKGHDTILVETGQMKASIVDETGDSIRDIVAEGNNQGLVFGTSDEKAPRHQTGTTKMPARPPIGIQLDNIDVIANQVADLVVESLKG